MINTRSLIADSLRDFRSAWKKLALAAIAYEIIAFILLTPLVGLQFRIGLAASGNAVLADQDILLFFLGPVGWFCLTTVGTLWLGIAALRQSTLMAVLASTGHQHIGLVDALQFARANAWQVVQVTARIITYTLLTIVPFLVVAAAVYFTLLSEYDINFYLQEQPPVFLVAVGIGGVIVVTLVTVLLYLFSGWFLALPLLLFEGVKPSKALAASRDRIVGHRRAILFWILAWMLTSTALTTLATTIVVGLGRFIVPQALGSLELLSLAIGVTLLFWASIMLIVNLLSATTLSVIIFNLYRQLGGRSLESAHRAVAETAEQRTGFKLTLKTSVAAGVLGLVVAGAVGVFAMQSVRLADNVEVMAHRGSSHAAPENTIAAIKQAIEDGTDMVEIDVQETADGVVVVFHDSDFMKLSGSKLKIWDATMDDLQDMDIGSWFAPDFRDERVPTLAEVLKVCKGKIGLNIELKYYGHDDQLEQRVAEIVEEHGMAADVIAMSLKVDAVTKMKQLRPAWKVGLLLSVYAGNLKKLNADFVAVNAGFANRSFIRAAHDSGKEVYVWTVNDSATMSTLIGRGVDGLITDKPALARLVLEHRSQMSVPERLMMELAGVLGVVPEIGEQ
ncbi:MAG: glycerophosphodiester phosphodiesterase [Fuerstiella sp.]